MKPDTSLIIDGQKTGHIVPKAPLSPAERSPMKQGGGALRVEHVRPETIRPTANAAIVKGQVPDQELPPVFHNCPL